MATRRSRHGDREAFVARVATGLYLRDGFAIVSHHFALDLS